MLKKSILTAVSVMLTTSIFSSLAFAAFTAKEAAELLSESKTTAANFKSSTKGADAIFSKAKGVLVCPTIRKMGIGVGYEGGQCVLTDGTKEPLYYSTRALKVGALLGVEKHSMILILNTDKALANFTSGKRELEFGVDASVAVAKIGVGGDIDTTNLKSDIISFIFGEKGLMGDLSWEGSSFKKLDVE